MYDMELIFGVEVGLKDLNDMADALNLPKITSPVDDIHLKQTVEFIPNEQVLTKYCEIIKEQLSKSKTFDVLNVHFKGYAYLKETSKAANGANTFIQHT